MRCLHPLLPALLLTLLIAGSAMADELVIAFPGSPDTLESRFTRAFLEELFSRTDHSVQIDDLPPQRAIELAVRGQVDGDFGRVGHLTEYQGILTQIEEPIYTLQFTAYTLLDTITFDTSDTTYPFSAILPLNHKFTNVILAKMSFEEVYYAPSRYACFKMLTAGHGDAVICDTFIGNTIAGLEEFRPFSMIRHKVPIPEVPMYFYLNNRYLDLVPILDGLIKEMKEDGTYLSIMHRIGEAYVQENR